MASMVGAFRDLAALLPLHAGKVAEPGTTGGSSSASIDVSQSAAAHFGSFALFLRDATAQVVDWDGALGYAHRGLMTEAMTLSVRRGRGVQKWLPWLTVATLEPMVSHECRRSGGRTGCIVVPLEPSSTNAN